MTMFVSFLRKGLFLLILFPIAVRAFECYQPDIDLAELFHDVQMARVFPDSKTLPDLIPKSSPEEILKIYREKKTVNLKDFVHEHFNPLELPYTPQINCKSMKEYLMNWDIFLRSSEHASNQITSLIPLPCSYVVAGGRFREMYYWDGFFMLLGLALSNRMDLVDQMMENYAHLIDCFGFIPNGNRTYYLTRSQPPFFSLMVRLYASYYGLKSATRFLPQLEQEYNFWMGKRAVELSCGEVVLNRYWDGAQKPRPESYYEDFTEAEQLPPSQRAEFYRNIRATAESGWDFSSRWLDEKKKSKITQILPVDLNCLLYHLEKMIAELNVCAGCEERASLFDRRACVRQKAIQEFFWDPQTGFYQDYNFVEGKRTGHLTLAGVFPLLFHIADAERASEVASVLQKCFLYPGGLVTTLEETGEQWDCPNGWAPLQWVAVQSLTRYGYHSLAKEIVERWMAVNEYQYQQTGYMYEKYNVVDPTQIGGGGEYEQQAGFGWTNGVALFFLKYFLCQPLNQHKPELSHRS